MFGITAVSVILYVVSLGTLSLAATLPNYTGQYGVGTVDIEVPVSNPRNITDTTLKSNGQSAFDVSFPGLGSRFIETID